MSIMLGCYGGISWISLQYHRDVVPLYLESDVGLKEKLKYPSRSAVSSLSEEDRDTF